MIGYLDECQCVCVKNNVEELWEIRPLNPISMSILHIFNQGWTTTKIKSGLLNERKFLAV